MSYFGIKPVSPEEEFLLSAEYEISTTSHVPSPVTGARIITEPQAQNDKVEGFPGGPRATDDGEKDVRRIEHDIENLLSFGQSMHKDVEDPKQGNHINQRTKPSARFEQENNRRPDLTLDANDNHHSISSFIVRPPTPFHHPKNRRSFSSSLTSSPPTSPPSTQEELTTLRAALLVVQSHISRLDEGIKANIAEQVKRLDIPDRVVMDADSLPNFRVENSDAEVSRALLKTVKVCYVVERGLEVLMEVLEEGEIPKIKSGRRGFGTGRDEDGGNSGRRGYDYSRRERQELDEGGEDKKGGLLGVCLESPRAVRREMGSALKGFEGVIGYTGK